MKPEVAFNYQIKFSDAPSTYPHSRKIFKGSKQTFTLANQERIVSSSSPVSPEGSEWSGGGPCEQVKIAFLSETRGGGNGVRHLTQRINFVNLNHSPLITAPAVIALK